MFRVTVGVLAGEGPNTPNKDVGGVSALTGHTTIWRTVGMSKDEQLPFDEDMIERAGATLNDLVGHHLKHGASNPYIDVDDYVKRLCRVYAEQTLNAAFHGVAKMHTWTAEQVLESGRASRDRWVERAMKKRDECEKYGFKPGGVTMARCSTGDQVEAAVDRTLRRQQAKGQHPSNGGK